MPMALPVFVLARAAPTETQQNLHGHSEFLNQSVAPEPHSLGSKTLNQTKISWYWTESGTTPCPPSACRFPAQTRTAIVF